MNMTLQSWFEAQVDRTPSRIAVSAIDGLFTYRELEQRANRLAHRLRGLGVGPQTLVGICLPRSRDLIVAIVAVIKAGWAYLPLDPEHPRERLASYMRDSGASVLISVRELAPEIPERTAVVLLDEHAAEIEACSHARPSTLTTPESLAYVIYTSGSTGMPKGVMVTNRNVTRLFAQTENYYNFSATDVWTMFHSCAFDFSVWEIWGALLYGGRLVIVPFAVSRQPAEMARLIRVEGVTVLNQTPSAFRQIGRALVAAGSEYSLRYIIFGGEALDFGSLRPWIARYGAEQPQLVNMYGITETTVHVTYRRISREDVKNARGSLIGTPIPDLTLLVLDDQLRPVAPGATGEIFVIGEGVARGYLNRPELTAQRFLDVNGFRAYRSGDLARMTADGDVEYMGRADQQVKIRGFRVELGEISAKLGSHTQILDNAVIAIPQGEELRLVAYCVAKGEQPAPAALRRFLASQVPEYMIPAAFVFVDALPLTVNGKLDRVALPAPEEKAVAYSEPRSAAEILVAEAWRSVLKVEQVGRGDNFLALGGDSLSAAQAIGIIWDRGGIAISFHNFFQASTLADLASLAGNASPAASGLPVRQVLPHNRPLPASFAQERLWLTCQMNPDDASYNETVSIHIAGPVDAAALESALTIVAQRHESLRTTFEYLDGELRQIIHPDPLPLERTQGEAAVPFDLRKGPLWRIRLVQIGEAAYRLDFTVHHIVWDAFSERVFVSELEHIYRCIRLGIAPDLRPLSIQSADITNWERQYLTSLALDRQLDYWKRKLGGDLPIMSLPAERPRPRCVSPAGARHPISLTAQQTDALRDLASREGVTLFCVLAALMKTLLHRYTGANDIVLGTVTNGRRMPEMESQIGYYVNPLALRTQLHSDLPFQHFLARVGEEPSKPITMRTFPSTA
jgi:amino acid adenylation domain-containing protein